MGDIVRRFISSVGQFRRKDSDNRSILIGENWLHFKLYRAVEHKDRQGEWKTTLDWYHSVLRRIVTVFVESRQAASVFFGIYGPEPYSLEGDKGEYERLIAPPPCDVAYIRLRICILSDKNAAATDLIRTIESHKDLIWDYEVLKRYAVRDDLGGRYGRREDGSIDDTRTMRFIRYWDAACRYILLILADQGNWIENVDVWGVPHLVNNSLGGWLRHGDARCPKCKSRLYMDTGVSRMKQSYSFQVAPVFYFACPVCYNGSLLATNI